MERQSWPGIFFLNEPANLPERGEQYGKAFSFFSFFPLCCTEPERKTIIYFGRLLFLFPPAGAAEGAQRPLPFFLPFFQKQSGSLWPPLFFPWVNTKVKKDAFFPSPWTNGSKSRRRFLRRVSFSSVLKQNVPNEGRGPQWPSFSSLLIGDQLLRQLSLLNASFPQGPNLRPGDFPFSFFPSEARNFALLFPRE